MANKVKLKNKSVYFPERIALELSEILNYPLTVIEAPMGYGKTTHLLEFLNKNKTKVLWQKVFDDHTFSFWVGFCSLFREISPSASDKLFHLGFPNDSVTRHEALSIISGLEFDEETILVFDDFHKIDSPEMSGFMELLVQNELELLHIVVTTRFASLQSIEELALKGYCFHIQKGVFEYTAKEIKGYFKMCGISLSDAKSEHVLKLSEGWISAIYLMMLNYQEDNQFNVSENIYNLIDKAIYKNLSEEMKSFLLHICVFESITSTQAEHMWQKSNASHLLREILQKNAFVRYEKKSQCYHLHNLFIQFLRESLLLQTTEFRQMVSTRAAKWYVSCGDYLNAIKLSDASSDFEGVLDAIQRDKGHCIINEHKDFFIKFMEKCPQPIKMNYPRSLLVVAMSMFTFNEIELFQRTCAEFCECMEINNQYSDDERNNLLGEFQLLLSFTYYNDIQQMLQCNKNAVALMTQPVQFLDVSGGWTMGSPSVLYMFYREQGQLNQNIADLKEAMPFYYQLTNSHGKGAELVLEAEAYFYRGDFINAEIVNHKGLYLATKFNQIEMIICCLFLEAKIAFVKGDYAKMLYSLSQMRNEVIEKQHYHLMHTVDLCEAYVYTELKQYTHIPKWIVEGDFESSRLYFPAMAFMNIIYGKILICQKEYLKILGLKESFLEITRVFPNLLGEIYTLIYESIAQMNSHQKESSQTLACALALASADQLWMPFVENSVALKNMLESLSHNGQFKTEIKLILELSAQWQKSLVVMEADFPNDSVPLLTEREREIALLAAEGYSNKLIGEQLFISQNTVKTILKSVFDKLGINSRALLSQILS